MVLLQLAVSSGIENYSETLVRTKEGEPPPTLFEYLPKDSIIFIDESHVTYNSSNPWNV